MPIYAEQVLFVAANRVFLVTVLANIMLAIACLAAGRIADRMGAFHVLALAGAAMLFAVPLLFL